MLRCIGVTVAFCLIGSAAAGQTSSKGAAAGVGFVTVGVGAQSSRTGDFTQDVSFPYRLETAIVRAEYSTSGGAAFDIGGGYRLPQGVGFAVALGRFSKPATANVHISIPNNVLFNTPSLDDDSPSEVLTHVENAAHFDVVYAPRISSPVVIMIFGGPTHFSVRQRIITDVTYNEIRLGSLQTDTITGYKFETVSASTWGFNGGVFVNYMITRNTGIGGMVRASSGTAKIKDGLESLAGSAVSQDHKIGGLVAGASFIVQFGG